MEGFFSMGGFGEDFLGGYLGAAWAENGGFGAGWVEKGGFGSRLG